MGFHLSRAVPRFAASGAAPAGAGGAYCVEHTTEADFAALEPLWRKLFGQCSYPTPFASWEWSSAWWEQMRGLSVFERQTLRLLILTVHAPDGAVIGLAPFYCNAPSALRLDLRYLRLFGAASGAESATEEPIILLRPGSEDRVIAAILRHFKQPAAFQKWDYLTLRWPDSALSFAPPAVAPQNVCDPEPQPTDGNEVVFLPGSWEAYQRGLSKSMRDNLAYYPRLLTRRGFDWRIRVAREPEEIAAAADILVELHHRRAESDRGTPHTNHLPEMRHRRLLNCALPRLAAQNMAAVFLLEVNGEVIAALCALENADTLTVYYTGYDTLWYGFSPITILTAEAIRCAIANGRRAVNFLPTPALWKTRWGAVTQQPYQEMRCLRLRPLSLLRSCAAYRGKRTVDARFLASAPACAVALAPPRSAPSVLPSALPAEL